MPLRDWRSDNDFLRFDSEYQRKSHLKAIDAVRRFGAVQFKDDAPDVIHPQEIVREYVDDDGVWFLRAQNVRPLRIDPNNKVMITKDDAERLSRNLVKRGDILVTRTGANRGHCAYFDRNEDAIASSHTFIIRPKSIDKEFLTIFLNTHHGAAQIDKGVYGAVQPEIAPYYLCNIWVPNISKILTGSFKKYFEMAGAKAKFAEQMLRAAENILLSVLGLTNWVPPEPLSYSASSHDAFAAGRLDAQYFHPKFADMHARIKSIGDDMQLGAALALNARGRQPQYVEAGLQVVNSKHVRTNRVILDDENRFGLEDGSPVIIRNGDVLLNGTGVGTIGRAAPYLHAATALPDNHVTVLRPKTIDPIYLSVFLNSPLGQLQIERFISGSSGQIELYPSDIAKIVVWDAPKKVQQEVRRAILAAFDQERHARDLLDAVKRAVEIAIEDSEAAALRFLEDAEP